MKAYYRNFNQDIYLDNISKERIKGGYGVPDYNTIYIDENLPIEQQPLVIIHEVLNLYLKIEHPRIDQIGIDLIDCLQQLGFEVRKI